MADLTPRSGLTGNAEYDVLPAFIRATYTLKEWLWLGAEGRANLLQRETENDWEEP